MVFHHTSYRAYLKAELSERFARNPRYTLRAFARDLGISPAGLSRVIKGKLDLSEKMAVAVSDRLGLPQQESDYFRILVQYEKARTPEMKEILFKSLQDRNPSGGVRDLSVDLFKTIADWYHLPILEMSRLENFDFNAKSVARALGISTMEAEAAIERLLRLELLITDPKTQKLAKAGTDILFRSANANAALRRFHRQMLGKALDCIEGQTPKEKLLASETLSIDPDLLPEAFAMIDVFLRRMSKFFEQGKKRKTYQLGVQLFNLTNGEMK